VLLLLLLLVVVVAVAVSAAVDEQWVRAAAAVIRHETLPPRSRRCLASFPFSLSELPASARQRTVRHPPPPPSAP
jgi:hypothetical protein